MASQSLADRLRAEAAVTAEIHPSNSEIAVMREAADFLDRLLGPGAACERCRFWDSSTQHRDAQPDTTGLCRRRPPRTSRVTGMAVWPFARDTDWCFEFQARAGSEETL